MKKENVYQLFGLLSIPLFFYLVIQFKDSNEELAKKVALEFYEFELKGIVKSKGIDTRDHNSKKIVFNTFEGKEEMQIFPFETEDVYNHLNLGDTLIKNKNEFLFSIKNGLKDTLITPEFNVD